MSQPPDASRVYRWQQELVELVEQVTRTHVHGETVWIEWKSEYDLIARCSQIARYVLGLERPAAGAVLRAGVDVGWRCWGCARGRAGAGSDGGLVEVAVEGAAFDFEDVGDLLDGVPALVVEADARPSRVLATMSSRCSSARTESMPNMARPSAVLVDASGQRAMSAR
jgi:hypothetical protein